MSTIWHVLRRAFRSVRCPGCEPVAPHGINRERFERGEER